MALATQPGWKPEARAAGGSSVRGDERPAEAPGRVLPSGPAAVSRPGRAAAPAQGSHGARAWSWPHRAWGGGTLSASPPSPGGVGGVRLSNPGSLLAWQRPQCLALNALQLVFLLNGVCLPLWDHQPPRLRLVPVPPPPSPVSPCQERPGEPLSPQGDGDPDALLTPPSGGHSAGCRRDAERVARPRSAPGRQVPPGRAAWRRPRTPAPSAARPRTDVGAGVTQVPPRRGAGRDVRLVVGLTSELQVVQRE